MRSKKSARLTRIFRAAAERVDGGSDGSYSCLALQHVLKHDKTPKLYVSCWDSPEILFYLASVLGKDYSELDPSRSARNAEKFSDMFINELNKPIGHVTLLDKRQLRVMLLLFMAEAWQDMPGAQEDW